ncbi:hypothetical protein ACHAXA_003912 [Cyclostephanos tholiformis]|uniref:Uncharacterized protein n=1 Tax=Cyclostephanos tholiformis TaxID=382380 RepID=A0ABD3REH5_9STRA
MRYLVALLMLLAVGSNVSAQSDDSPKAGLTGNLLDERGVRKEREERATSDSSIAPPIPFDALGGDSAAADPDEDMTTSLLDRLSHGGTRGRFLGKSEKSPATGKAEKAQAQDEGMTTDEISDEYQDDDGMETYSRAKEDKRGNRKDGHRKKNKRNEPKKKRRGGKATGRRAPRKRFAILGGKGTKL